MLPRRVPWLIYVVERGRHANAAKMSGDGSTSQVRVARGRGVVRGRRGRGRGVPRPAARPDRLGADAVAAARARRGGLRAERVVGRVLEGSHGRDARPRGRGLLRRALGGARRARGAAGGAAAGRRRRARAVPGCAVGDRAGRVARRVLSAAAPRGALSREPRPNRSDVCREDVAGPTFAERCRGSRRRRDAVADDPRSTRGGAEDFVGAVAAAAPPSRTICVRT